MRNSIDGKRKRKNYLAILILLSLSLLGACKTIQEKSEETSLFSKEKDSKEKHSEVKPSAEKPSAVKPSAEKHSEEADSMSIKTVTDTEFVVMRLQDYYVLLPGGSRYVFPGEGDAALQMTDGEILRIVADAQIYEGGVAGYMQDVFLINVKKQEKVSFKEAIEEMDFPGTEGASFWFGECVVKYCEGDHIYFVIADQGYMDVYMDGQLVLRYEDDFGEDHLAPFFDFLETNDGNVEYEIENENTEIN